MSSGKSPEAEAETAEKSVVKKATKPKTSKKEEK